MPTKCHSTVRVKSGEWGLAAAAYPGVKLDLVNVPAAQQFEIYTDCVRTRVTNSLGLTACLDAVSRFRKHIGYSTRAFAWRDVKHRENLTLNCVKTY